ELAFRRRQAHVHDVELLLDRPPQTREQHGARAGVAGAEHARAVDLALRREPTDHPGARGAVAAEIALLVGRRDRGAVVVDADRDRAVDLADERMVRVDAAVEDADSDVLTGRALERPLARDALRPLEVEPDVVGRAGRQRPRWKRALLCAF